MWILRSLPGLNAHFGDKGLCTLPGSSTRLITPRLNRRARLLYSVPPLLTSSLSSIWRFPMMFFPGQFSGCHQPTSSLVNPHDQKLSPGTASTIVNLAFINSCLYLGTHSYFLRIICFITSSRLGPILFR